jgi:hypothetical protein
MGSGPHVDTATTETQEDKEQVRKDLEKKIELVESWVNTAIENGLFSEISKKTEIKEVKKG